MDIYKLGIEISLAHKKVEAVLDTCRTHGAGGGESRLK
jgi:hypothetical protein